MMVDSVVSNQKTLSESEIIFTIENFLVIWDIDKRI